MITSTVFTDVRPSFTLIRRRFAAVVTDLEQTDGALAEPYAVARHRARGRRSISIVPSTLYPRELRAQAARQ